MFSETVAPVTTNTYFQIFLEIIVPHFYHFWPGAPKENLWGTTGAGFLEADALLSHSIKALKRSQSTEHQEESCIEHYPFFMDQMTPNERDAAPFILGSGGT